LKVYTDSLEVSPSIVRFRNSYIYIYTHTPFVSFHCRLLSGRIGGLNDFFSVTTWRGYFLLCSLRAVLHPAPFILYICSYCLSLNTSLFCHHHRCVTLNNSWTISHTFQLSFSFYGHIYLIHPPKDIPTRVHAQCSVFNARETFLNAQDIGARGFHQQLVLSPSFYWKIYIAWFFIIERNIL